MQSVANTYTQIFLQCIRSLASTLLDSSSAEGRTSQIHWWPGHTSEVQISGDSLYARSCTYLRRLQAGAFRVRFREGNKIETNQFIKEKGWAVDRFSGRKDTAPSLTQSHTSATSSTRSTTRKNITATELFVMSMRTCLENSTSHLRMNTSLTSLASDLITCSASPPCSLMSRYCRL